MDLYYHVKNQIAHIDTHHPITVALSGGVDSIVLLHILKKINSHTIHAIHIHHGIQAINDQMQKHCELFCKAHHIPLKTVHAKLSKTGNLENIARIARYQAFSELGTSYICLAHHENDLYETLIMRLYQGRYYALPYSMPLSRMKGHQVFLRPLLAIPKSMIISYALDHQLQWVEDPSNHNTPFLRNRIRKLSSQNHELRSIGQKLHHFSKTVFKFENILTHRILPATHHKETFDINAAYTHPYLFRLWILQHTQIQVSEEKARDILLHFQSAKPNAQPEYKIHQFFLRRYNAKIFLTPEIIQTRGTIYHHHTYTIAFRHQLSGHSHFLKRLFQQKEIPKIYRNQLPIILENNTIIAVWGIYLDSQRGLKALYWNNPPEFIENYPFPLLKEDHFQYTKPENTKDSYGQFNC